MMTDPEETASLVNEITAAFREHAAGEAVRHPVTYREASSGSLPGQIDRYRGAYVLRSEQDKHTKVRTWRVEEWSG